jgi:hypothetical protein
MKCKKCSKDIPHGFTDCPWCGATGAKADTEAPENSAAPGQTISPTHSLLIASSLVFSGILFGILNYFVALRTAGPIRPENSAYLLGRCVGSLFFGALFVAGYCKIRGKKLRGPIQALLVLTLSSLFTLLTLAIPPRPRLVGLDRARVSSDVLRNHNAPSAPPVNHTKWDPAARSLMKDVQARNQQYVSEISTLDETAKPLYTSESFHDSATIQQMIEQLHARLSVADKYTDWQPIFSKMKDYVAAVDANQEEKRKFMAGFDASLPKTLTMCKTISDKEHAWLQATLDLYQFALLKEGAYVWRPDNLVFKSHGDSDLFRQKFIKARTLNAEFLKAYWQVRQAQEAMMAQLGLQDAEADQPQPK